MRIAPAVPCSISSAPSDPNPHGARRQWPEGTRPQRPQERMDSTVSSGTGFRNQGDVPDSAHPGVLAAEGQVRHGLRRLPGGPETTQTTKAQHGPCLRATGAYGNRGQEHAPAVPRCPAKPIPGDMGPPPWMQSWTERSRGHSFRRRLWKRPLWGARVPNAQNALTTRSGEGLPVAGNGHSRACRPNRW
jgi:hypothetical protein